MGSSKPREVSTAAKILLKEHEGEFSRDFSKNKAAAKKYIDCNPSLMNEVAGAISAEMRKKANKKAK